MSKTPNPSDAFDEIPHEIATSSRVVFEAGPVRLRVDDVELPTGRQSHRAVIEHPGAVAIAALTEADELILVRQWRYAIGGPLLEIPAGTREAGEPAVETARRELIEETGFAAEVMTEIRSFYTSAGYSNEEMTLFLATGCRPVARDVDPDELTRVVLVPRADIASLLQQREIHDAKSLIGILTVLNVMRQSETPATTG